MEAIVLAGGLGTRLRSVVADVPKPMAPVAGRPFLDYILHYLKQQGITKVVLAVGYKWEIIRDYYAKTGADFGLELNYSIETEPLGTGGAIFQAAQMITGDDFFIINGDTSFPVNLTWLKNYGDEINADIMLSLKLIHNSDRYGSVQHNNQGLITSFKEKTGDVVNSSEINGGVYYMNKRLLNMFSLPSKFSFEIDFMQAHLSEMKAYCKVFDQPFIDIGIPEDYYKAQQLFINAIS